MKVINVCKLIIAVFLPIVILFTVLELYAFNINFYMSSYRKNNVIQTAGMSENDLKRVTVKIMDYLKGKEDNLEIKVHIRGEAREAFGERERLHMVDVKKLFLNGYIIRNIGIILLVLSIIILIKSKKPIKDILTSLLYSGIFSFLIVIVIFILTKIDFDKYFTYFHQMFFNNDLWLLDPDKEVLIQLVPLEFFIDITTRIIGWFLGIELLISLTSFYLLKRNKHKYI